MADLYYAAACQTDFPCPRTRDEIAERTRRMCDMVEQTITGYEPFFDVRLLAFPEFAHAAPIYDGIGKLRDRLAIPVPNEHTERYRRLCRQYGCYIQTGSFLEADPDYPEVVFNTTVLLGPDGVLSKYRKVNPWIPWEIHASPHDIAGYDAECFPVVATELGHLGVAICYDWLFPETIRQIAFNGAEIIVRISAYMDPWGATPPLDWWTLFNRARAAENSVYVVAANQGASLDHYPPFSWPGGSMVVDYDGRIVEYDFTQLEEIGPAYAVTVHKSQGAGYPAVIMPIVTQHFVMLQRNLLYTAITRGKQLVVLIGTHKALDIALQNDRPRRRLSGLTERLIH